MRKAVYTTVVGGYDALKAPVKTTGFDHICFTDNPALTSNGWELRDLPIWNNDPNRTSRMPKLLPHKYLSEYDLSIYVDGSIRICRELGPLLDALQGTNWAAFSHCGWNTPSQELAACIDAKKDDPEIMSAQIKGYFDEGMPDKGLMANGVLIRKHKEEDVIKAGELWWEEVKSKSRRDQLSFMYVAWKTNLNYSRLPGIMTSDTFLHFFRYEGHPKVAAVISNGISF